MRPDELREWWREAWLEMDRRPTGGMDHGEAVGRADGTRTDPVMADGGQTGDGQMDGGEEHVCEACGRTFPTEAALEDHMREQGIVD